MLLPSRPLRLRWLFVVHLLGVGIAMTTLGIAGVIGCLWWQCVSIQQITNDARVWREGVPALKCSVDGTTKTHSSVFHQYDLTVTYVDSRRDVRTGTTNLETLIYALDQSEAPQVRYLEADPERMALSWAINASTGRWVYSISMLVGLEFLSGASIYLGIGVLRQLADTRRCAKEADEMLVVITKITPVRAKGIIVAYTYDYEGTAPDGFPLKGKASFGRTHQPLYADVTRRIAVGLMDPEDRKRVVLLGDDLYPFVASTAEKSRTQAAIAEYCRIQPQQ